MKREDIIKMQLKVGALGDGFWGPKSEAACRAYLLKMMPRKNPWPDTSEPELTKFYGPAYSEARLVNLAVPSDLGLEYSGMIVKTVRCHERVAESFLRVLIELSQTCPWIMSLYDGCWNSRPMRGGTRPSLHARGAAADFDSTRNRNLWHWPAKAIMPLEYMEAFSREGWTCAGPFWSRDAMHAQATKPLLSA